MAEAPSCSGPVTPQCSAIVLPGLVNTWSVAFVPGKTQDPARPRIWKQLWEPGDSQLGTCPHNCLLGSERGCALDGGL